MASMGTLAASDDKKAEYRILPLLVAAFIALVVISLLGTQRAVQKNTDTFGANLVESYAADETRAVQQYASVAEIGMSELQALCESGLSGSDLRAGVYALLDRVTAASELSDISVYAIVNGQLLGQHSFQDMAQYDYTQASWYQEALAYDGAVLFTDAHESLYTPDGTVISVVAADAETGNAFIENISLDLLIDSHLMQSLPAGGAYFLCDDSGTMLYYTTPVDASEEDLQAYATDLYTRHLEGTLQDGSYIRDLGGNSRVVYVYHMENGWHCVLTIPRTVLLSGMRDLTLWYALAFVSFLLIAVILWRRGAALRRTAVRTNDTLRALGNSYFALYRIDVKAAVYETIRAGDPLRAILPASGKYDDFLKSITATMDERTAREFRRSFSLEHLRLLCKAHTEDFGGDFLPTFDGKQCWLNVRLLPDESHTHTEVVMCFRQVDEEKRRELQHMKLLESALEDAENSRKSQLTFFSGLSHDMRTPLNVILGMTEMALREDCTTEKRMDYLTKMRSSGRQLLALINDILDVSRMESGHVSLETKRFDICDVVTESTEPFRLQCEGEGKTLTLTLDVETKAVLGDPDRLTQILNNLISNAVKFTSEGGLITVRLEQHGDRGGDYRLTVADNGTGMSPEFLPRLFEPYEREMRFSAKKASGTGLGMPIVKALVTRMGGKIEVDSRPGEGTCFTVTLPLAASTAPSLPNAAPTEAAEDNSLRGHRVLVAEDNPLNTEIITALLTDLGVQIVHASNGREATQEFEQSPVGSLDAIVMDMQMPVMDGCEAVRSIRGMDRPDAQNIPIIALTANAFAEDMANTARAGMNAHLSKPIDASLLRATLTELIAERAKP